MVDGQGRVVRTWLYRQRSKDKSRRQVIGGVMDEKTVIVSYLECEDFF
jgi:hypothetical protein